MLFYIKIFQGKFYVKKKYKKLYWDKFDYFEKIRELKADL